MSRDIAASNPHSEAKYLDQEALRLEWAQKISMLQQRTLTRSTIKGACSKIYPLCSK